VRFKVFVVDPAPAREALYHAERLMRRIEIIGVPSFDPLLALEGPGADKLAGAALLVNAAIPQFNCPIIELGIRLGAHSLDLASDMYNPETANTLTFAQYAHDAALRDKGVAALINMGISPGNTNFLIGERICRISSAHRKDLTIESIDLYLLEDIDADAVIFSWAPAVALDELSQSPLQLRDGRMIVHEPFTGSRDYRFPHERLGLKPGGTACRRFRPPSKAGGRRPGEGFSPPSSRCDFECRVPVPPRRARPPGSRPRSWPRRPPPPPAAPRPPPR